MALTPEFSLVGIGIGLLLYSIVHDLILHRQGCYQTPEYQLHYEQRANGDRVEVWSQCQPEATLDELLVDVKE
jgi:hypothetical protein